MRLPGLMTACLAPIPIGVVQAAATQLFSGVLQHHPEIFDRLGDYAGKRFGFVPTDLPFSFQVLPSGPTIHVFKPGLQQGDDVTIRGPILVLLALLEGRLDGDALFFARKLEIAGDTEAALALRNALDDSNLDLPTDIGAMAGPLRVPLQRVCERLRDRLLHGSEVRWS